MAVEPYLALDGDRLVLVVANTPVQRAAARAVRGARAGAKDRERAAFSYPAEPEVAGEIVEGFRPRIDKESAGAVMELVARNQALRDAAEAKESGPPVLQVDPLLKTEPMEHQVRALNFCAARFGAGAPGTGLLMEQGTGKTLVAIGLANWLHAQGKLDYVLVVCPNTIKGQWSSAGGEIDLHSEAPYRAEVLRGTRRQRLETFQKLLQGRTADLLWIVNNYEQYASDPRGRNASSALVREFADAARTARGMLVLDESSAVKNVEAKTTKSIQVLRDSFPYRLILNGTPVEAGPLDVYAQFECVQPGCLGFKSPLAFEKTYAKYRTVQVMNKKGRRVSVRVVADYQNLDDLNRRLAPVSFRATTSECMELPPVIPVNLPVELSAEQARLLRELKEGVGRFPDGEVVDGRNVLTRYQRCTQLVGGWVKATSADGLSTRWRALDKNPKLDALQDYLQVELGANPRRKVVVFAEHPQTEVEGIAAMARQHGWGCVAIHGGVKEEDRDKARQSFVAEGGPRVLVAQWETASRGLNLTRADTVVFYSMTWKYGTWSQARKRIHRKGQEAPHVREVYLLGEAPKARGIGKLRTIDHVMVEAMKMKRDVADVVTGDRYHMEDVL